MAISEADIKMLWGRAAAFCSRPGCGVDLTRLIDGAKPYNIGEMAHVIAKSKAGPRGGAQAGSDTYDNLILLCPTHHREVDKAPEGTFPEATLHEWKRAHEHRIRALGSEARYQTIAELKSAVSLLLAENRVTWETLGPKSEVARRAPGSNAHQLWEMRRLDKILPNNRKIVNAVRANQNLLSADDIKAFAMFINHAESYEDHVYDRRDEYPLFPTYFEDRFNGK